MRRFLSALLAMVMAVTMIPALGLSDGENPEEPIVVEEPAVVEEAEPEPEPEPEPVAPPEPVQPAPEPEKPAAEPEVPAAPPAEELPAEKSDGMGLYVGLGAAAVLLAIAAVAVLKKRR